MYHACAFALLKLGHTPTLVRGGCIVVVEQIGDVDLPGTEYTSNLSELFENIAFFLT